MNVDCGTIVPSATGYSFIIFCVTIGDVLQSVLVFHKNFAFYSSHLTRRLIITTR